MAHRTKKVMNLPGRNLVPKGYAGYEDSPITNEACEVQAVA